MARFDLYAPLLKKLEGGYVDHPLDKGGPTNCGVTLKAFQAAFGKDKTPADLKAMTDSQWTQIMKKNYWDVVGGDYIENQSVAEIFCDWAINSGVSIISKVQSILGVSVDGKVGPKTINAINGYRQKCLHCKIWDARKAFYERIVASNPSQKVFLKGWMNRLANFVYDGK